MTEYIERSAGVSILRAKANMAVLMEAAPYFEKAAQMLEKLPAADVAPVVRCRDCVHRTEMGNCGHPRHHGILPSAYPYDFCSYGERKDDDENG